MKKYLKKNRIYFELLFPILLGFIAIIISLSSLNISKSQLTYQEILLNPQFYVECYEYRFDTDYSDSSSVYSNDRNKINFRVFNEGAKINNEYYSFFPFYELYQKIDGKRKILKIPIDGGFRGFASERDLNSNELTNFVSLMGGKEKFEQQILPIINNSQGVVGAHFKYILKINYIKINGTEDFQYFDCMKWLSKNEGIKYENAYNNLLKLNEAEIMDVVESFFSNKNKKGNDRNK